MNAIYKRYVPNQKLTNNRVGEILLSSGLVWFSGKYIESGVKNLDCVDDEGYKYRVSCNSIQSGQGVRFVHTSNPFSVENIILWLSINNPNIKWNDVKFIGGKYKYNWHCEKCKNPFKSNWNSIYQGHGCGVCTGHQFSCENTIRKNRPDLIKYFKNEEDADKYAQTSNKKVQLVCPICKLEKTKLTAISKLSTRGFSCDRCSDSISVPEKFGINLIQELKIDFVTQKIFEWSKHKKYDFYIPSLNMIIEVHGGQHYRKGARGLTLTEEQENDLFKYNLAIGNGIKDYIVIDARNSTLEWLKENYSKQMEAYYNLNNINWIFIWEKCQLSSMVEIWEAWNNKNENETTTSFAKRFNRNRKTIKRYLRVGAEIGKCNYNPKEEMVKSGNKAVSNMKIRIIYQYSLDGKFIRKWNSERDARLEFKICQGLILRCCNGKQSMSGGYKWSYFKCELYDNLQKEHTYELYRNDESIT